MIPDNIVLWVLTGSLTLLGLAKVIDGGVGAGLNLIARMRKANREYAEHVVSDHDRDQALDRLAQREPELAEWLDRMG
ncbi:MAG: hypothetical protein NUW01_05930, partial [Gemmatimonadaceae bacterium]|nr:hypothetical protein [Gemmatimonadaceae bacterium]